jgi:2-phosphosulfolactate phosphatase
MEINILHLLEGAKEARGLTVIIDVFRAFTVVPYVFNNGARLVIPVSDAEEALALKKKNPDYILIGECDEKPIHGFDFGNSPSKINMIDFEGRTIVHRTSSGTQGIVNASQANEILTGSFVNAKAIIHYIEKQNPPVVSLVCMGYACEYPVEEDTFCAEYIKNSLEGEITDFENQVEIIKKTSGQRFFDPEKSSYSPPEDFYLCTQLNKFDFVVRADRSNHQIKLFKY